VLSRDRLFPLTPLISSWTWRSLEYINQLGTAHEMNNKIQVDY